MDMNTHLRHDSGGFSGYQQLPQEPASEDPHDPLASSLVLEDEAGDFVAQEEAAAHDPRVRYIHFVLGCAVLLPWNALITASPYFLSRLEGSPMKSTFNSYLSTTFTVANFGFLAHATVSSKLSSSARRAMATLAILTFLAFTLTISTWIHAPPGLFFAFIMLNGIAQAGAGSYLQTAIIAVASLFGPSAVQSMMSGQAAVGVAVSGVQVISTLASTRGKSPSTSLAASSPEESSAFTFFLLSTLFLIFSAAAQSWLVKLPAYTCLMDQYKHINAVSQGGGDADEHSGLVSPSRNHSQTSDRKEQIMRVTKANAIYNLAVAYVFVVTLAVFPPITLSVAPVNPRTSGLVFSAIHFFVFNVGDFCGRFICSYPRFLIWSAKRLLGFSLARTLFIPLFLLCNVQRSVGNSSTPFINSDIIFMFILFFFGMSNGYGCSMCMIAAPSVEHNPRLRGRVEDVDTAATVGSFFLVGGLAVGSFASFGVRAAICDCNPFRS